MDNFIGTAARGSEPTTLLSTIIRARAALNTYIWASPARRSLCKADEALEVTLGAANAGDYRKAAWALIQAMNLAYRALSAEHPVMRAILAAGDELCLLCAAAEADNPDWVFGEGDIISVDSWAVSA